MSDANQKDQSGTLKTLVGVLSLSTVGLLIATIVLATNQGGTETAPAPATPPAAPETAPEPAPVPADTDVDEPAPTPPAEVPVTEPGDDTPPAEVLPAPEEPCPVPAHELDFLGFKTDSLFYSNADANTCSGAKLEFENFPCTDIEVQPQAGANITKGYTGEHDVGDVEPQMKDYNKAGMCPVNVHWHLGTEHYSVGEFDENGSGPNGNVARPDWADRQRALAEGEVQDGFRCHHYDETDEKFTKPYEWKYCVGMEVGETYEVHWPHSAAGACGTVNQYQTPFYDGVFCNLPMDAFLGLGKQDIASAVGVHGQVFTIVNDDAYFYPDMIKGMIVDEGMGMGQDVTYYTGSTTGSSRDNEKCSPYSPITWQVDRKCHMISASSFDKMCFDMMMQRDDMSGDLYAHGSRELVNDVNSANNHQYPDRQRDLADAAKTEMAMVGPSFLDLKAGSSLLSEPNTCAGKEIKSPNAPCVDLEVLPAPQAGANVTLGFEGDLAVGELVPISKPYYQNEMCPVNVHWHLGTEHYSVGEYDEDGSGPNGNVARPDWADRRRSLAEGEILDGFRCHHYDADDEKFTKPYEWKHCVGMEVGETYEVHWPHSAFGACGTVDQYQTPFYDGVFCNLPLEVFQSITDPQVVANAVGVHGQVFTIVNDESYFYADLIRGMVIDEDRGMGQDITAYTGSTTGQSRNNEVCSSYSPITWQVDRKCHMISASSFDKMCYDMKMQRDDMSDDLYAHGSRPLVDDKYAADNQVFTGDRKYLRG